MREFAIKEWIRLAMRHWWPFYRASMWGRSYGSRNSVRPSVRLSHAWIVICDKSKWCTANILIPYERAITRLLWHQQWLVGDAPFPPKSALKVTHPPSKNADFERFPGLGASEPKTILLPSKTDRMPILERELDRVGCYRHCTAPMWAENCVV